MKVLHTIRLTVWQSNSSTFKNLAVRQSDSLKVWYSYSEKNWQSGRMRLLQYDCLTFEHSNRMTVWLPNSLTVWLWKFNNLTVSSHQQPLDPQPQLAGYLILVGDSPGVFQGGQEVRQTDRQTHGQRNRQTDEKVSEIWLSLAFLGETLLLPNKG